MKKKNLLIIAVLAALLFATLYSFKSYTKPPDASSKDLGTIIASVVEYSKFAQINGDPIVIDPQRSKWIPADGRSILGSQLSKVTGLSRSPDLRGRFLRGLNTFYNNGQPPLIINTADGEDPSSNRKVGSYEGDALKKHTHPFTHIIQVGPNEPQSSGGGFSHSQGGSEGYNNYKNIDENPNDGLETRPKNIAVYYYIRIN